MTTTPTTYQASKATLIFGVAIDGVLTTLYDLRYLIALCITLVALDFWFGWRESRMRYIIARENRKRKDMLLYKFHFSRAGRRTANKLIDYVGFLILGVMFGYGITEQIGWCDHVTCAAICMLLACLFEVTSIAGHWLALHGIEMARPNPSKVAVFVGKVLAKTLKTKSAVGGALEETIEEETAKDNE